MRGTSFLGSLIIRILLFRVITILRISRYLEGSPKSWSMDLGGFVLGSLMLYLKGTRTTMFQLYDFYYNMV